jgi:hypothetical protein
MCENIIHHLALPSFKILIILKKLYCFNSLNISRIGKYLVRGKNILAFKENRDILNFEVVNNNNKYDVELRLVRTIELEDNFQDGRGNVFTQMKDFIIKQ